MTCLLRRLKNKYDVDNGEFRFISIEFENLEEGMIICSPILIFYKISFKALNDQFDYFGNYIVLPLTHV